MSLVPQLPEEQELAQIARTRAMQALRLVAANLPHLSGLARLARVKVSRRASVAAVASSGLVLVNPEVYAQAPLLDLSFILAHELMHLALDTHGRRGDSDHLTVNFAHDYIINDMLCEELGREPPLDGLYKSGARETSLEELVSSLKRDGDGGQACWNPRGRRGPGKSPQGYPMRRALQQAGIVPEDQEETVDPELSRGDMIPEDREPDFEPHVSPQLRQRLREEVRRAAAKAAALGALKKQMEDAGKASTDEPKRGEAMMRAVRAAYATPWDRALQRWVDAVAPGERTYMRPSRRRHARSDIVLPGRRREGWVLHVLLDTSGSMVDILPRALGAISYFAENAGVSEVHVVQCDVEVTHDDWVEPEKLAEYQIGGFGYSDMSPGILHLARDPEISAILVLTDGYIEYPVQEPPYRVMWVLIGECDRDFEPAYGEVVYMEND